MNTSNIAKYAPQARTDFIAAVTRQAAKYGIRADEVLPIEIKGDVALIGDFSSWAFTKPWSSVDATPKPQLFAEF